MNLDDISTRIFVTISTFPLQTLKAVSVEEGSSELSKLDENLDLPPLTLIAVSVEEGWQTQQAGHES